MGKTGIAFICTSLAFLLSCKKAPDNIFIGRSNVIVFNGINYDTLSECICWNSKNDIGISIGETGYSVVIVDVLHKNGQVKSKLRLFSDYGQFNGHHEKQVEVEDEKLDIVYHFTNNKLYISGDIDIISKETDLLDIKDRGILRIAGSFNCVIEN